MTSMSDDSQNAALHLEGRTVGEGWVVGPRNKPHQDATGGYFSITYPVARRDGAQGFLKVLNLAKAFDSDYFIDELNWLTAEYVAERDLCILCGEQRLSRVVTAIDHGQFQLSGFLMAPISYIIFELATHDVRVAMSTSQRLDATLQLHYLHNLATGVAQLHARRIAHQDLKPSNFLVFPADATGKEVGKIGDLGRAFRSGSASPHDTMEIPGDHIYAPPEQLYRHTYADEATRRYAADLYQVGSIATFLITGTTMNAHLAAHIPEPLHWNVYGDTYQEAIPYLDHAFGATLESLSLPFSDQLNQRFRQVLRYLCEPDAERRGHPAARRSRHGSPYRLERIVSELDLIARRAALEVRDAS